MPGIFISYRRDDSAGHAGRIYDHLCNVFGRDSIFHDVDDIRPGQVFPDVIRERIAGCAVVVVVIGKRWLEILRTRAGGEPDFVSIEIQSALECPAVIIPVLVGGASMPRAGDLPDGLAKLAVRDAEEIRDATFAEDIARLVKAVKDAPGWRAQHPPIDLTGTWIARMQKHGRPFSMRLNFEVFGGNLYGTVEYPTGDAAIQDAKLDGPRFSFHTSHVPQFASEPAVIRTEGEIVGDEIRLISADDNGVARGVATKQVDRAEPA